jgi:hypothetical protein
MKRVVDRCRAIIGLYPLESLARALSPCLRMLSHAAAFEMKDPASCTSVPVTQRSLGHRVLILLTERVISTAVDDESGEVAVPRASLVDFRGASPSACESKHLLSVILYVVLLSAHP